MVPVVISHIGTSDNRATIDLNTNCSVPTVALLRAEGPLFHGCILSPRSDCHIVTTGVVLDIGLDPCRDRAGMISANALPVGDFYIISFPVEDDRTTHRTANSGAADCKVVSVEITTISCLGAGAVQSKTSQW